MRHRTEPSNATNPTSEESVETTRAVAIQYDGNGAPRVTAKGDGEVAQAIIALAQEHGVTIHEDRPLVELLSQVQLDEEIPEQLYAAVAIVLTYVYRVTGKAIPGR